MPDEDKPQDVETEIPKPNEVAKTPPSFVGPPPTNAQLFISQQPSVYNTQLQQETDRSYAELTDRLQRAGLFDPNNPDDVARYRGIATKDAKDRLDKLTPNRASYAESLAPPPPQAIPEVNVTSLPKAGQVKTREPSQVSVQREQSNVPVPQGASGGGGGVPATPGGSSSLAVTAAGGLPEDYSELEAASNEEIRGRQQYGQIVGDALGAQADEERGSALASEAQAKASHDEANDRIAEIGQLVDDYANAKIDPNQWWEEKNVPQKIGAVVGTMLAGLGGGVAGAMGYFNNMVDKNLAIQQDAIRRKGAGAAQATNLLYAFLKNSETEQDAFDKARAAMISAAMTDVQKASVTAQTPIQVAQIKELLAKMKAERDLEILKILSKGKKGGGGGGGGVSPMGLEVDTKEVFTDPATGITYKTDDPGYTDKMRDAISALRGVEVALDQGKQLLSQRGAWDYVNPIGSDNLRQGEAIDANIQAAIDRAVQSGRISTSVMNMMRNAVPHFGSRTASLDSVKIDTMRGVIENHIQEVLRANGAQPVHVTSGPGRGKNAGKWTTYATPVGDPEEVVHQVKTNTQPKIDYQPASK